MFLEKDILLNSLACVAPAFLVDQQLGPWRFQVIFAPATKHNFIIMGSRKNKQATTNHTANFSRALAYCKIYVILRRQRQWW